MHYFFDRNSPKWKPERSTDLFLAVRSLVHPYNPTNDRFAKLPNNLGAPYVEDYPDGTVAVRRITHLSEAQWNTLREELNQTYIRIMHPPRR